MSKLKILKGLPASGKSTWARKFCEKNPDWVRVCRDDLRNMRGRYWLPKDEDMITSFEDSCVFSAIDFGKNVVLDATNLNDERTANRIKLFKSSHPTLQVETKFFAVDLQTAIRRDLKRANSVGADVITKMHNKYFAAPVQKYEEDNTLPHCVVVDIDGTLAKMCNRSPYDYTNVINDSFNFDVAAVVDGMRVDNHIIVMSGREDICREETEAWLSLYGFDYTALYMRKEGDHRKDSIVKQELFDAHIRNKYYCNGVFDDRDQVVEMWRSLGLRCYQVAEGNF